jgi:hypothetical protein
MEKIDNPPPPNVSLFSQASSFISSIIASPIASVSSLVKIASPFSIGYSNSNSASEFIQPFGYDSSNNSDSKAESEEERFHREKLESIDAENCSVVSSRLTLMEVHEDEMIENTLNEYIKCVEGEIDGKSPTGSIPQNLYSYCSRALKEFIQTRHQAIMLQKRYSSLLSCFEVVAPDLYFDITTFSAESESTV